MGVEPLDAHLDAAIEVLTADPLADRIAATDVDRVVNRLSVPYLFDGATAALLQGAPVPIGDVQIAVRWADADAFADWLTANYGQRWNTRLETFGYLHLHPSDPGEHRWRTIPGVIKARMCDDLPAEIEVRVGERSYRVVPLADLQVDDPRVADLLNRYRVSRQAQPRATS